MKFSIQMAALNEEKYIGRAISSILMQGVDFELFINDGGSSDGTEKIVKAYQSISTGIIYRKRPEGVHLHDWGRETMDLMTGDVTHAMSAHVHYLEGALKFVEEHIKDSLFGSCLHEDGTIQRPTNPEDMSSHAMFLSLPFLRENKLSYEKEYPDIADYVLRKRIWIMGKQTLTDERLVMQSPRPSKLVEGNAGPRYTQSRAFLNSL